MRKVLERKSHWSTDPGVCVCVLNSRYDKLLKCFLRCTSSVCWFCWLCLSLLHSRSVDFAERVYTRRASSLWERQENKLCCSLGQDCLSCYQLLSFGARALCWLPEMYMLSTEKSDFHFGPLMFCLTAWVHVKSRDMNGMLAREILLDLSNIKVFRYQNQNNRLQFFHVSYTFGCSEVYLNVWRKKKDKDMRSIVT